MPGVTAVAGDVLPAALAGDGRGRGDGVAAGTEQIDAGPEGADAAWDGEAVGEAVPAVFAVGGGFNLTHETQ